MSMEWNLKKWILNSTNYYVLNDDWRFSRISNSVLQKLRFRRNLTFKVAFSISLSFVPKIIIFNRGWGFRNACQMPWNMACIVYQWMLHMSPSEHSVQTTQPFNISDRWKLPPFVWDYLVSKSFESLLVFWNWRALIRQRLSTIKAIAQVA